MATTISRQRRITSLLRVGPWALCFSACVTPSHSATSSDPSDSRIVIQSFTAGLSIVHAASPSVGLSIRRDPSVPEGPVLEVEYPARGTDPAARDVWCDVANRDWSHGSAIEFGIKPEGAIPLSVSFLDSNRVAYTARVPLHADIWQIVRLPLDSIEPNPYFQPPGADLNAPLDVHDVARIGFAPQGDLAGRFLLTRILLVE